MKTEIALKLPPTISHERALQRAVAHRYQIEKVVKPVARAKINTPDSNTHSAATNVSALRANGKAIPVRALASTEELAAVSPPEKGTPLLPPRSACSTDRETQMRTFPASGTPNRRRRLKPPIR